MMDQFVASHTLGSRVGSALDRAETLYLRILRAVVLIVATGLVGFAIWLSATSLWRLSKSPSSVHEKVATVSPADLVTEPKDDQLASDGKGGDAKNSKEQVDFYNGLLNRYYAVYRTKFERYAHADDKKLSREEFDDLTLSTTQRLAVIRDGKLDFGQDRDDLNALVRAMDDAAVEPSSLTKLQKYRVAQKVKVTKQVQRLRTQIHKGWNSYATNCPDWYETPMGCAATRVVEVPYTETVTSMEYPKDVRSPTELFKGYQDRFFKLLAERRQANVAEADSKRSDIVAGQAKGRFGLMTALELAGGFLVLMFFFLLIAIERHQRHLSRD